MTRDELQTRFAGAREAIFGVGGTSAVSGSLSDAGRSHLVAALDPGPGLDDQTLGGAVLRCRVSGDIQYDAGQFGPKTWAQIPILVLAE